LRIGELYKNGHFGLSFEVYPPKTEKGLHNLIETCGDLAAHKPVFISGTYGAGGSTQANTLEILEEIQKRYSVTTTAHFTCVGSKLDYLKTWLTDAQSRGIENIMALRGDPPQGIDDIRSTLGDLHYASELVAFIKEHFPKFGIGVAGYPEKHREAPSEEVDLENLKRKVGMGADAVFTQLFFDNEDFFRFRDRCAAVGIEVPIIPGILPVLSLKQVQRITALCGSRLPAQLMSALEKNEDPDIQIEIGIEHAIKQSESLVQNSVPGIHYYVLNRSDVIQKIISSLNCL
jgi:methylenetetrahydrofolate reductase (NADPH)